MLNKNGITGKMWKLINKDKKMMKSVLNVQ